MSGPNRYTQAMVSYYEDFLSPERARFSQTARSDRSRTSDTSLGWLLRIIKVVIRETETYNLWDVRPRFRPRQSHCVNLFTCIKVNHLLFASFVARLFLGDSNTIHTDGNLRLCAALRARIHQVCTTGNPTQVGASTSASQVLNY